MALRLAVAVVVVALAGGWLFYSSVYGHGGGRPLSWQELRLGRFAFAKPTSRVLRDREALADVVAQASVSAEPPPQVDFARRDALLLATGPRSSTGYAVRIFRVVEQRRRVLVIAHERAPVLGDRVRDMVTYPYRLISFRRTGKPVVVEWVGRP